MKKRNNSKNRLDKIIFGIRCFAALVATSFKAIVEVAWGVAGIFIFLVALNYYSDKYAIEIIRESVNPLFILATTIIISNMELLVLVFFIIYAFRYFGELEIWKKKN